MKHTKPQPSVMFPASREIRSHLIDVNLLLECVMQTGEMCAFSDSEDMRIFLSVLAEIQSHINAIFPEMEMLDLRMNAVIVSLSGKN